MSIMSIVLLIIGFIVGFTGIFGLIIYGSKSAQYKRMAETQKLRSIGDSSEVQARITESILSKYKTESDRIDQKKKMFLIIMVIGLVFFIIGGGMDVLFPNTETKTEKEKQEEEWLEENFGDGKGQEIQDAIDDYKNNN